MHYVVVTLLLAVIALRSYVAPAARTTLDDLHRATPWVWLLPALLVLRPVGARRVKLAALAYPHPQNCLRRSAHYSAAAIDRGWPHQVVLPARLCEREGYNEIHEFCRDLTLCSRGHSLHHDGQWFHVYCFKEPADAQKFMERFDGEKFDPVERGRGTNWAR
jgi:hypothetical protein